MNRLLSLASAASIMISSIAWACGAPKPMPPFVLNITIFDIAWKMFQGYKNAPRAAAMEELDEQASATLGAAEWKDNNYVGPVTYRVHNRGANIVTEDKPCNKTALENQEDNEREEEENGDNEETGGGGGGYGGYYWNGGRFFNAGGTCLYGCGGTVTVGEVDPQ